MSLNEIEQISAVLGAYVEAPENPPEDWLRHCDENATAWKEYFNKSLEQGYYEIFTPAPADIEAMKREILHMPTISSNKNDVYKADVLKIIDKYASPHRHEEWIVNKNIPDKHQCPECGMFICISEEEVKEGEKLPNFCSNCGTRLNGEPDRKKIDAR